MSNLLLPDVFFQAQNATKSVSRRGWGSLRRSPDLLVGWGGENPLPIPLPSTPSAPRLLGPPLLNSGYAYGPIPPASAKGFSYRDLYAPSGVARAKKINNVLTNSFTVRIDFIPGPTAQTFSYVQ